MGVAKRAAGGHAQVPRVRRCLCGLADGRWHFVLGSMVPSHRNDRCLRVCTCLSCCTTNESYCYVDRNLENPMRYMLLIYTDEKAWTNEEREHCYAESTALTLELHERGQYVGASPLLPVATARSVRVREGKQMVTD